MARRCTSTPKLLPCRDWGWRLSREITSRVQAIVKRWARRYDERFLEQLLYMPVLSTESFDRIDTLRDWCRNLEAKLNTLDDVSRRYRVTVETVGTGGHRINLQRLEHGLTSEKHIPREFFESAEYLRIAELAQTLSDLMGAGAFIQRGDDRQDVASFKVAMTWLFEQAKKGQSIQRYKGLGENERQSTMGYDHQSGDPPAHAGAHRRRGGGGRYLYDADGRRGGTRREFIEKNALQVSNLDI